MLFKEIQKKKAERKCILSALFVFPSLSLGSTVFLPFGQELTTQRKGPVVSRRFHSYLLVVVQELGRVPTHFLWPVHLEREVAMDNSMKPATLSLRKDQQRRAGMHFPLHVLRRRWWVASEKFEIKWATQPHLGHRGRTHAEELES